MGFFQSKPDTHKPAANEQPKRPRRDTPPDLKVKRAITRTDKFARGLEARSDRLERRCKELLKEGKRNEARRLMAVKLVWSKALKHARGQLETLDRMAHEMETQAQMAEIVRGIKAGTEALEELNREMPLEKVEMLLERADEAADEAEAVDRALAGRIDDEDDVELDAELEEMDRLEQGIEEKDEDEKEPAHKGATGLEDMPVVPKHPVQIAEKEKPKERQAVLS